MADDLASLTKGLDSALVTRLVAAVDRIIDDRVRDVRLELMSKFMGCEVSAGRHRAPLALLSKQFCASVNFTNVNDDYLLLGCDWTRRPFATHTSDYHGLLQMIDNLRPLSLNLMMEPDDPAYKDWESFR